MNREISYGEVLAAIQRLKKGKAPGEDQLVTDMIIKSGENMKLAIHKLFEQSWKDSKIPEKWKIAKVQFLKKTGKKSYHKASSYRPISLTSSVGNCLEKIIEARLYVFSEHHKLLDNEKEGFRHFKGTTGALIRLSQDIYTGFIEGLHTVGIFIDLEKAFDTVWREGLLTKLHRMGITGQIWHWLRDFLTGRKAFCMLKHAQGNIFQTSLGLPQGSVLSPTLFNLFLSDIFENVKNQKVKFADDGTIWKTGKDIATITRSLEEDMAEIQSWIKKWRMKVNLNKTEFCVFSRATQILEGDVSLTVSNIHLRRSSNPKLLGVVLDEKLQFTQHIRYVQKRALKSLNALLKMGKTEKISPANMVKNIPVSCYPSVRVCDTYLADCRL